ncbi:unnamed protein product, partial [Mesorhabditis belari]
MAKSSWRKSLFTERPKECPQLKVKLNQETSEDCLFLNVFGPTKAYSHELLPVLVYIHGGAYKFGTGNQFEVENMGNLSKQGFVVVTLQYRLSTLGFFHVDGSKLFPANLGLHDTHLALQFISKHIKEFGGDPKRITLIGQSAGACSAHALSISPNVNKELFHRVILMSAVVEVCYNGTGSGVSPSAVAAKELCNIDLNEDFDDEVLFKCLNEAPLAKVENVDQFEKHEKNWVLFTDGHFFPEHYRLMNRSTRGHDYLIGVTSDEWAFFENLFAYGFSRKDFTPKRFEETVQKYMGIEKKEEIDLLKEFYTKEEIKGEDVQSYWFENVVNSMTDLAFHVPILDEIHRLMSATNPPNIYLYTFNITAPSFNQGYHASHCSDLQYIFGDSKTIADYPYFQSTILGFAKNG